MKNFILVLLLILTGNAFACSCIERPNVKEGWDMSADVFIGQVMSVTPTDESSKQEYKTYLVTIKILTPYKQELYKGYETYTFYSESGDTCAYSNFKIGEKYLIYADRYGPSALFLQASQCSRTTYLDAVDSKELAELEQLRKSYENEYESYIAVSHPLYEKWEKQITDLNKEVEIRSGTILLWISVSGVLFLVATTFILLYLRTKKQLKSAKKSGFDVTP